MAIDIRDSNGQDPWCRAAIRDNNIFAGINSSPTSYASPKLQKELPFPDYRTSGLNIITLDQDTMLSTSNSATLGSSSSSSSSRSLNQLKARYMGYGVVRLYREYEEEHSDKTIEVESGETTVAIVAAPAYLSPTDLLGFLGDSVIKDVSHFRLIKSDNPNRYMVLMKFRANDSARKFQDEFNGIYFNSLEAEQCHTIFVKSVIFEPLIVPHTSSGIPYLMEDPFTLQMKKSVGQQSDLQAKVVKELPTCPVCLERMDSDVSGLLTISCQHTFHCNCLSKWRDDTCPVCRYSNLALDPLRSRGNSQFQICSACGGNQNLWICLICGNIGCGRYDSKHAIEHFESTNHCFAMDITTQRVWDYAGDNYVHRLIQNEQDGKLVELDSGSLNSCASSSKDKNAEYNIEYSNVLLSQLESQREYYESRLMEVHNKLKNSDQRMDQLERHYKEALESNSRSKQQEEEVKKLQDKINNLNKLKVLAQTFEKKYKEEKSLSDNLSKNLESLKLKNQELTQQNQELEEQVKDLMFYLESQEKFKEASDDVKNGTIVMQQQPSARRNKRK